MAAESIGRVEDTLELVVTEKTAGNLATNISQLEAVVERRLADYSPEGYMGDADLARKDRAELNKAAERIRRARIALMDELMRPYQDFEERCKGLERKIAAASKALDEIVKDRENREREAKMETIEALWSARDFDLFPLEKIFNRKWLNKTFRETDIAAEMDAAIERTYKDLRTIELYSDDADTLKAHYLISLDIGDTLDYGEELKKKRGAAEREAAGREEREHGRRLSRQEEELRDDERRKEANAEADALAEAALASVSVGTAPARKEFVITVRCLEDELLRLRGEMNALGIEFSVQELVF